MKDERKRNENGRGEENKRESIRLFEQSNVLRMNFQRYKK